MENNIDLSNIKLTPLIDTLRLEDISDEIYFSEKYSEYISNSRLRLIDPNDGGSPEKFFEGLQNNKIYSDSLIFGSAVHELFLQKDEFKVIDSVNRSTGKCGFIADIIYDKSGKLPADEIILDAAKEVDYYHGLLTENQLIKLKSNIEKYLKDRADFENNTELDKTPIYLDEKSRDKLYLCLEALNNNSKIMSLVNPKGILKDPICSNEATILLDVEVKVDDKEPFILRLKSKLDHYSIDEESSIITINDLKTTGKMVNVFNESIQTYHYYRELAMYSWLLDLCGKKFYNLNNCTIKGNFLVVSTIPNYYTKVVPMTKKLYKQGWEEFTYLLKLVAYYKAYGY